MKKQIEFTQSAWKFYTEQAEAVRTAFDLNIMELSETGVLNVPNAKKLAPNLYEIRVKVAPNQYRLLYCYADGDKVLILSGFVKKTRKTPKAEIDKAKQIRKAAGA
jgi:phage-related protein